VNTDQNTNEVIAFLLFTPLVRYDSAYRVEPYLAERWTIEPAGVTFHLRRDVRWHDGAPVTAHDVAFTFARAKDPATGSPLASAYFADVASAAAVDSYTVRFEFERPHAQAIEDFVFWAPMPRHLLDTVPPEGMRRTPFNRAPVGSGPFRFVEWRPQLHAVFERNPSFPETLGGPPHLDRIVLRMVEESTARLTELLSGALDLNLSLWPAQARQVERARNVRLLSYDSRIFYYIGWNTRHGLFERAPARRALTLAIDRRQIIEALLDGRADPAAGPIPPWHPLYDPELEPLPYDPSAARALLAAEGWRDRDGDGVLEDSAGRPFRFELMANVETPVRTDIAQIVQADLRKIGVRVDVRTFEWQTMLSRHRNREFEAVVTSWVLDNFRVDPYALFHSAEADRPGSYNRSGYRSERADRWIEAGRAESDPAAAIEIWSRFTQVLQEDQPFTFLLWQRGLAGVRDRLHNVHMDARGQLATAAEWWVSNGGLRP
jgi:peptide/nickel transport system substrate-binding protein